MSLSTIPRYQYRARRYPWAQRIIEAAEARHGPPQPTCFCGHPVKFRDGRVTRCPACGRTPGTSHYDTAREVTAGG